MTSKFVACTVLLACLCRSSTALAQPDDSAEQEVKQKIEALQQQLESLEKSRAKSPRTTQLGPARTRGRESVSVTRLYDLSDLFAVVPNYPARGGEDLQSGSTSLFPGASTTGASGMGGGGFFGVDEERLPLPGQHVLGQANGGDIAARVSLDDFTSFLKKAVQPEEGWDSDGGASTMARIGYLLFVTTDEDAQAQIEAVLDLLRGRWGTLRTVTVEAWWLALGPDELAIIDEATRAERGASRGRALPEETWTILLGAADEDESYHTVLSCYNGQTVHALSGDESLAVTDLKSVISMAAEEGENVKNYPPVYEPMVTVVQEGVALEITPIANRSGKIVVLDVHSRVSGLQDEEPVAQGDGAEGGNLGVISPREVVDALDRPVLSTHRLSTTLRVPVGPVVQVGGMTLTGSGRREKPGLYLFVRVDVQELRDDLSESEGEDATANPARATTEQGTQESPAGSAVPESSEPAADERDGADSERDEPIQGDPDGTDPE